MVLSFVVLGFVYGSSGCVLWFCAADVFVVVCWLRFGGAQCARELAVEVRQGTLPR